MGSREINLKYWLLVARGTCRQLRRALPNHFHATWEFPKIRGTVFWGPYINKDPTI